jgi:hypothetical protein
MIDIDSKNIKEMIEQWKNDHKMRIEDYGDYRLKIENDCLMVITDFDILTCQILNDDMEYAQFAKRLGDDIRFKAEYHRKQLAKLSGVCVLS